MSIFAGRLSRKNFGLGFLFIILGVPVLGIVMGIILAAFGAAQHRAIDANTKNQPQADQAVSDSQYTP